MARIDSLGWALVLAGTLGLLQAACMGDDMGMVANNNGPDASRCMGGEIRFSPAQPGEGDLISATLGTDDTVLSASWTVTGPNGSPVPFEVRDESRSVEFTAVESGEYVVDVETETDRGHCSVSGVVTVHSAQAKTETYRFVFTPSDPASFPRQEFVVTLYEDTPIENKQFSMDDGREVHLAVNGPNGALSSYVRLEPRSEGVLLLDGFYTAGSDPLVFHLDSQLSYDILVVPQSPAVAPQRFESLSTVELTGDDPYILALDAGRTVVGLVSDSSQQGLLDAQVALSCGGHPAALASTDITGHFALSARPGACSLSVLPPRGTGLPAVSLDGSQGLSLPDSGQMEVTVGYADLPRGSVDFQVRYPDGEPASDANVILVSQDASDLAQVEALVDGVSQGTWGAAGRWQATAVTDSQGRISVAALPAGHVSLLVEPERREYTSRFEVEVPDSDATSLVLTLSEPVAVQGRVFDPGDGGRDMSAVEVSAVVREGTGSTFSGHCATDGSFSLDVPAGLVLDLLVEPGRDTGLVRRRFDGLLIEESGPVPGQEDGIALEQGLTVSGRVTSAVNVGGTLVQVFCADCGVSEPLDEAVVDSSGSFLVLLPNPK